MLSPARMWALRVGAKKRISEVWIIELLMIELLYYWFIFQRLNNSAIQNLNYLGVPQGLYGLVLGISIRKFDSCHSDRLWENLSGLGVACKATHRGFDSLFSLNYYADCLIGRTWEYDSQNVGSTPALVTFCWIILHLVGGNQNRNVLFMKTLNTKLLWTE